MTAVVLRMPDRRVRVLERPAGGAAAVVTSPIGRLELWAAHVGQSRPCGVCSRLVAVGEVAWSSISGQPFLVHSRCLPDPEPRPELDVEVRCWREVDRATWCCFELLRTGDFLSLCGLHAREHVQRCGQERRPAMHLRCPTCDVIDLVRRDQGDDGGETKDDRTGC